MVKKVGITGRRAGLTPAQEKILEATLLQISLSCTSDIEFHHGDCTGADELGHKIADSLGWRIVIHPPINDKCRAYCDGDEWRPTKKYLLRNDDIVDECSEIIAVPATFHNIMRGSGTWYTIRRARRLGRGLFIIFPDGSIMGTT